MKRRVISRKNLETRRGERGDLERFWVAPPLHELSHDDLTPASLSAKRALPNREEALGGEQYERPF